MLPWGVYTPDTADYVAPGAGGPQTNRAENVIPRLDGYGPFPSITSYTSSLPGANPVCRGAFRGLDSSGVIWVFACTASKIYLMNNSTLTWNDVSKPSITNIASTRSSTFGDMTAGGGQAAAFDGVTTQVLANCDQSTLSVTSGYVGAAFSTPIAITSVTVFGSSDQGYQNGVNQSMTITLYGRVGSPANATDGQVLGSITFTDTGNESTGRVITSTNAQLWDHVWVTLTTSPAAGLNVAELQIFGTTNYSLPANDQWSIVQYGNYILFTEVGDAPQQYQLNASTFAQDIPNSPPFAKYIGVLGDFVVLTGLLSNFNRTQWSARGDQTGWTSGVNGADFQDFYEGGACLRLGGGELSAQLFQDSIIRRMTYQAGAPFEFSFDKVSQDIGIIAPRSLCRSGNRLFWLSNAGFMMSIDGSAPIPIGKDIVDVTFLKEWDNTALQLTLGFNDPRSTRIFFAYKSIGGTAGVFDKIMCYDWLRQRWTHIVDISGQFVTGLAETGYTEESIAIPYPNLETIPISLDAFPAAYGAEIAFFDTTNKLGFLKGPNLEARLETSLQGDPSGQSYTDIIRPITDSPLTYTSVSQQQQTSDTPLWSAESPNDNYGRSYIRLETRFFRVRNRIPAGTTWTYTMGVELVNAKRTGGR